ncbi:hypothetical protein [Streptomyces venezuelae]|uniref:hypothetical protein n=2 Tax=Streptomyces venezuelae TaxID=54571 RepID=UPI00341301EE
MMDPFLGLADPLSQLLLIGVGALLHPHHIVETQLDKRVGLIDRGGQRPHPLAQHPAQLRFVQPVKFLL